MQLRDHHASYVCVSACMLACVCVCLCVSPSVHLSAIISATEKVNFNETGCEYRATGAQLSNKGDGRSCGVIVTAAKYTLGKQDYV